MKYIKHFLSETIFMLPYLLMAVSFCAVLLPRLAIDFDKNFWCNLGGYSLFTNVLFLYVFTFNRKYCFTTRALPVAMTFVSVYNMCASFLDGYFLIYKYWFEVIILSITLFVSLVVCISRKLNT